MIGYLPLQREIAKGADPKEFEGAVEKAVWVTEVLLDLPIIPRSLQETKILLPTWHRAVDYPIRDVYVSPSHPDNVVIDSLGLVKSRVSYQELYIYYRIGYKDGELPAVVKQLITLFTKCFLGTELPAQETRELTETGRWMREKVRRERDGQTS